MYNYQNLKVGADPELFFVQHSGSPMSAEGLLGGSKYHPKPMEGLPEGFFIQEDNVAAEFNIPPANNSRDFSNSINKALKYLNKIAKNRDLELAFYSSMHFPMEQLLTPHAQTLGCEPDLNAWTGEENPRPIPPETLRTAAGHVHVGWKDPTDEERQILLRTLDLFLGVPSIVATRRTERRSLYGKAGACRLKTYGVEYRTLDNFWLPDNENRVYVFKQVENACATIIKAKPKNVQEILEDHEERIVKCINEHDQDLALNLCAKFDIPMFPKFAI